MKKHIATLALVVFCLSVVLGTMAFAISKIEQNTKVIKPVKFVSLTILCTYQGKPVSTLVKVDDLKKFTANGLADFLVSPGVMHKVSATKAVSEKQICNGPFANKQIKINADTTIVLELTFL